MRRDPRITVALCLVVLVALLNLPLPASMRITSGARDGIAAFQNGLTFVIHRTTETLLYLMDTGRLISEKRRTEAELARLQHRLQRTESLIRENEEFRELLGFKANSLYRLLPCRVIGRGDAGGWWQTLRLNRGSNDGVEENMAVVVPDGLLGRTREVTHRTCDVLLITDPRSRVAGRLASTHALGIIQGQGVALSGDAHMEFFVRPEPVRMDYLPRNEPLENNDKVVTSGLGGVYPEGLPIGRVMSSSFEDSDLYRTARVVPYVDITTVRFAFVVLE